MASKKGSKGRKSSGKRASAAAKKSTTSATKKSATKKSGAKKKSLSRKPVVAKGAAAKAKKKSSAVKAAAKPAAKKKPVAKAKPAKAKPGKAKPAKAKVAKAKAAAVAVRRRDNGGHIEKKYGRELLARGGPREKEDSAFIGGPRAADNLAEELGEQFVETATSGEDEGEDVLNQEVPEERGGPFVVTTAGTEFADGVDESNPKGAKAEPFPRT